MSYVVTGKLAIWNALKGLVINVGVEPPGQADAAFLTFNTTSGYPNGGYFYSVWTRLASAGGFTINWVQMPPKSDSQTLGAYALQMIPMVDVHAGRFISDTSANRLKGIDFSAQVTDANQVFVTSQGPVVADNTWSFALPFENSLWGVIVAFLLAHGVILWIFREPNERFQDFLYTSTGKFVGATDVEPKMLHTQLLSVAFCFCIFIFLASYTANLATFLIAQTSYAPAIQSLEMADAMGAKICVLSGSSSQTTLTTYYPNILQVPQVLYASLGLATGQCVGALMTAVDLAITQTRSILDANCNFVQVGGVVKKYSGAWALQMDYGCPPSNGKACYCTSFMNQVLTQLFLSIRSKGLMESDLETGLAAQTDLVCPVDPPKDLSLHPSDLKGIFYLYGFCIAICLSLYVCQYFVQPELERLYLLYFRNPKCDACLGITIPEDEDPLADAFGGKGEKEGLDMGVYSGGGGGGDPVPPADGAQAEEPVGAGSGLGSPSPEGSLYRDVTNGDEQLPSPDDDASNVSALRCPCCLSAPSIVCPVCLCVRAFDVFNTNLPSHLSLSPQRLPAQPESSLTTPAEPRGGLFDSALGLFSGAGGLFGAASGEGKGKTKRRRLKRKEEGSVDL